MTTSRLFALAAALGVGVAALFLARNGPASWTDFPIDDAWIHLVYARSLGAEGLPAYNPGAPEAGFSSLTWILALAPLHAAARLLSVSAVVAAKLASLVAAVFAAVGLARLTERDASSRVGPIAAVALTLGSPGFAFSAVSGMEVCVTAALAAWAFVRIRQDRLVFAGVLLGLAAAARLEASLIVPCAVAAAGRPSLRRVAALTAPALALLCAWALYNLAVTGAPLPNTFYCKAGGGRFGWNVAYVVLYVFVNDYALHAVALLGLAVVGGLRLYEQRRCDRAMLACALAGCLVIAGILGTHSLLPGLRFYHQRYVYPFGILLIPLCALGVDALATKAGRAWPALAAAGALAIPPPLLAARASYREHCREIDLLHTRPAREIDALTPKGRAVVVEGAGSSRYHASREIVDFVGLNHHRIAHARRDGAKLACLVLGRDPALFVVPTEWLPMFAADYLLQPVRSYRTVRLSSEHGSDEEVTIARAAARPEALRRCGVPRP